MIAADRLLEEFDRLSEAPGAVERFRKFAIELALCGKLTDSGTGRIDNHEDKLGLPVGWRWTTLGELQPEFQNGESSRGIAGGVATTVLRLADIEQGRISHKATRSVLLPPDSREKYRLRANDFLVVRVNGSPDIVGRFIHCELDEPKAIYCDHFIRMRIADALISPMFLKLLGNSSCVRGQIESMFVTSAGQKTVNQRHISSIGIPLPPLPEQHRIVAKVDELMALCDQLEAAQAEREKRRQSAFTASARAFSRGDFPTATSLETLVNKSLTSTDIKRIRQTITDLAAVGNLRGPDSSAAAQESWRRRVSLASICRSITDGDHLPPPKADHGIPFFVIGNVRSGSIDFAGCRYVSPDYFDSIDTSRRPQKGDVLFTLVGSFAIPVVVRDDKLFCVQRHIGILRPSAEVDAEFLALALNTSSVYDQASHCATGIAQKTVPLGGLRRILIDLPSLAEQRRIVGKVDELMSLCDQLEAQLETAQAESRRLLDALLHAVLTEAPTHTLAAAN